VKEFRSVFPQVIMEMVRENAHDVDVGSLSAVLHKDAGMFILLLTEVSCVVCRQVCNEIEVFSHIYTA